LHGHEALEVAIVVVAESGVRLDAIMHADDGL
jgi:hypothetical protein